MSFDQEPDADSAARAGHAFDALMTEAALLVREVPAEVVIKAALAVAGATAAQHRMPMCRFTRLQLEMLDFFANGPRGGGP